MNERRAIDGFGAAGLLGFSAILSFNQVVIKLTGSGFAPVFQAGLRSALAIVLVMAWMRMRGIPLTPPPGMLKWGILSGLAFTTEFLCLYLALDHTSVARASLLLYSMPIWLALAGYVLLPQERLSPSRAFGMVVALAGVALAVSDRGSGQASLAGDLLAILAAMAWASIALLARLTPLSQLRPETQLLYQIIVSAVLLLGLSPLFGDLVRAFRPIHLAGLAYQVVLVVCVAYLGWFWALTVYRANAVASFGFLTPVLAVLFGWAVLGEHVAASIWLALALVLAGIYLINRR